MSEKNFVAYGDAESILTGYANRIKQSPSTFVGTQAQWNALSSSQKAEYELVDITDDSLSLSGLVDWRSNGELGAKNLIENTSVSKIDGNVQYTVNADKSISINILSSLSANAGRIVGYINVKAGLSYTLRGGISSAIRIDLRNSDYSMWMDNIQNKEVTSPKQSYSVDTFIPSNDATLMVYLRIDSSIATGNVGTVYPLLRFSTDTDETYQPYAMTNKEMTPYVQAISNPNLLDNPWFTVNQRGVTNAWNTQFSYGVDRWMKQTDASTTLSVTTNGITEVDGKAFGVFQITLQTDEKVKSLYGKILTLSVMYSDGTIDKGSALLPSDHYSPSTTKVLRFVNNTEKCNYLEIESYTTGKTNIVANMKAGVTIKAVKLEVGEVSTLHLDTAPNYQQELAKCQRYFVRYRQSNTDTIAQGVTRDATKLRFLMPLPVPMRTPPSVTASSTVGDYTNTGLTITRTGTNVTYGDGSVGLIQLNAVSSTSVYTAGEAKNIAVTSDNFYIDFSADL